MKDNGHILDSFCYDNFNLLFIILDFYSIAYADPIYDKEFCLLINLH